jgi:exodeoxyribonuclease V alpha subunit
MGVEDMTELLAGSVERITYYNQENGYSVVRLRPEGANSNPAAAGRDGLVTVTGNLPELSPGEHLRLRGRWTSHSKHGIQFQIEQCEQTLPATVAGMRRYLGSGLVKGIGPRLAERIVACFGAQTLEVIENHPERLREVPDIGLVRSRQIAEAWEEQKQVKEIMLFLHGHGVSTNLAIKIYKQYGEQALAVVKSDPYRLARDIFGVGFKTADKIARLLGLPSDHPSRIEAGVVYSLREMLDAGHVYAPAPELVERAAGLLELPAEQVPPALERLSKDGRTRQESLPATDDSANADRQPAVYLASYYEAETGLAERLRLLSGSRSLPGLAAQGRLDLFGEQENLSSEQKRAVEMALASPVSVLTGGPGTGKTTCIQALLRAVEAAGKRYALASPTGRAAKRLSEATGRPASTIHRLLGYAPGEGFKLNASNPLPVDLLVIDEASMLDLLLAHNLLKALRPGAHLLLVGDVDQLPSVGAGDVLRDLISSGLAPVTRLTSIFRQAAGSLIITNAHRINQGHTPVYQFEAGAASGEREQDFYLFPAGDPQEAARWVQEVVCERIPRKFGLDPVKQIQVLAPMYRGECGVNALNARLQASLNPAHSKKTETLLFGQLFRSGDKLMQIQNNYDKEVFNGDFGMLAGVDPTGHSLLVSFDGREVHYEWSEADQLVLAYAVSVHKSQGAEFPGVVIPLVTQHYLMLQRNLLYTAITRARELCVLVGSRRAIAMAVRNDAVSQRYTALSWRLRT